MAKHDPTEEEVRERAYAIFLARGQEHGRDTEDWLEAEAELRSNSDLDLSEPEFLRSKALLAKN